MIIRAKNKEISVRGIQSESIRQNGKSYPALRITVDGGLPQTEIDALCSGQLEIIDDSGNVIGTHEGYTTNAEHSLIIGKITTADQEIAELTEEITATKQEHTAYVATVQTILPVLDDAEAVTVKGLYPAWEDLCKESVTVEKPGYRFRYGDDLYKTVQPKYTFVSHHVPGGGTESLFTRIDETHAGTAEDPIPYNGNMVLENGKYYVQGGVVYLCTRDTGNPVYNPLSELVGLYVEIYEA